MYIPYIHTYIDSSVLTSTYTYIRRPPWGTQLGRGRRKERRNTSEERKEKKTKRRELLMAGWLVGSRLGLAELPGWLPDWLAWAGWAGWLAQAQGLTCLG